MPRVSIVIVLNASIAHFGDEIAKNNAVLQRPKGSPNIFLRRAKFTQSGGTEIEDGLE